MGRGGPILGTPNLLPLDFVPWEIRNTVYGAADHVESMKHYYIGLRQLFKPEYQKSSNLFGPRRNDVSLSVALPPHHQKSARRTSQTQILSSIITVTTIQHWTHLFRVLCTIPADHWMILLPAAFFPVALQSLKDLGRLTYRRFLELYRQMLGPLGRVISPSQGLYLHRTTQHRKTRTNIHVLGGIRTHYPSNQGPRPTPQTARPLWPAAKQLLASQNVIRCMILVNTVTWDNIIRKLSLWTTLKEVN
jgi:hypothetical protein